MALVSTVSCTDLPYPEARMLKTLGIWIKQSTWCLPTSKEPDQRYPGKDHPSIIARRLTAELFRCWQKLGEDEVEVLEGWLSFCELTSNFRADSLVS